MPEEKNHPIGTSDMPAPQTMEYSAKYRVTQLFMNDLETVLSNVAYADAIKYIDAVKDNDYVLFAVDLNEYIHSLSCLPYKVVKPLMKAISNKDNFRKYFELIEK